MAHVFRPLHSVGEAWQKCLAPGFRLVQPSYSSHLGNESQQMENCFSLSPLNSAFQMNIYIFIIKNLEQKEMNITILMQNLQ